MHQIKRLPEDFIVKEISHACAKNNGQYAYFALKKAGCTTIDALQALSKRFGVPLKHFGFAGNKDKNAVTEQKISIFRGSKNFQDAKFNNIGLVYLGNKKEPISLGDLEGNEFVITIRNLGNKEIKKLQGLSNQKIRVPNLFGPQRFSKNNHLVGKAIIKNDFRMAVELVLENRGAIENEIKSYLAKNKNNYVEALRLIPLKTRRLFVHSYQSFLFNEIIKKFCKTKFFLDDIKIPVIGFGFEVNQIKNSRLKNIFKRVIEEEKISPREFITSQMPELASEGSLRELFFAMDFRILEIANDKLNENKQKIKISFALPKSCYATVALEHIFQLH